MNSLAENEDLKKDGYDKYCQRQKNILKEDRKIKIKRLQNAEKPRQMKLK